MTERDDDLDFEFFEDEPATQEAAAQPRIMRRVPRPPTPPRPPAGVTPLLRLVGLIAVAILIVVLLVFWIQSCQGSSKRSSFEKYMSQISQSASSSAAIGQEMSRLLAQPGVDEKQLESKLNGFTQRQQQLVASAQAISPPGQLRDEQRAAVEAMQFRVSGLQGLQDAFRRTADFTSSDEASTVLAAQAQRLATSDVIWDDLFKTPATDVLKTEGVTGVTVPSSKFLITPDFASSAAMKAIWERLQGASSGGGQTPTGVHGTGIESVKVLPSGTELTQDTETTITVTQDLAFEVAVKNTGDSEEVQVQVDLTIQRTPTPITKTETIPLINAGETKTVVFRDLGSPPFDKTTVKVDVHPVPGEQSTANNSYEYPVIFTLSSP
jgi:CARDB protein